MVKPSYRSILKKIIVFRIKIFVLFFIGIGILHSVNAQHTIRGNVKDEATGENLFGVNILLRDLKQGVSTDADGNYQLPNIKTGTYLLELSALGYNSIVETHYIERDTILNFVMSTLHKELAEVVVTGVSRTTEITKNPIIIKSITSNYVQQNNGNNLVDVLKNIPGISQITTGAAISKPVIRGLGYNRVISLLNGIKQEGQQWGDEHGIEIDEYAIDRIEIIKGPGSMMYGSDGIAGVINFLTPKAPPLGQMKFRAISNFQSNNKLIGNSLAHSGNINGIQWSAIFSNKLASNFQNKYDGEVYNSGFKEYDGNVFAGLSREWGYAHLLFSTYNSSINLPEGERDSLGRFLFTNMLGEEQVAGHSDYSGYHIGFPHQKISHLRLNANNYFILPGGTINLDLGAQNNRRREYGDSTNPEQEAIYLDLLTYNLNARYNLNRRKGWETSLGFCSMLQFNKNKGIEFLIPDYHYIDLGGFIFTQKSFGERWAMAAGWRIDNRKLYTQALFLDGEENPTTIEDSTATEKFSALEKSFFGQSASLGLTYQPQKNSTIKFNISSGFRAPNLSELASNGIHEGAFRYELGNTQLKPESSYQIDLGYFINSDHVVLEITPFVNFISDFIYSQKLDNNSIDTITGTAGAVPIFQFTQAKATLAGGEVYLDFHPHPIDWLHIANSFSYVQGRLNGNPDSTKYLPYIPAPKYNGEIKMEYNKLPRISSSVYLKISLDYYFAQNNIYSAYDMETTTPSYYLLHAGLGAKLNAGKRKDVFDLIFNIDNITDVAYQNHLSRLKYAPANLLTGRTGIFNQGRNFSLKLIVNL